MGFRLISVKEKITVVCEAIVEKNINLVARRHRIARPTIYTWVKRGFEALEEALEPYKRGPGFKRLPDPRDEKLEEARSEIARLRRSLEEKEIRVNQLEKELELLKNTVPRPRKCPECGCEKVYKNGTYTVSPRWLSHLVRNLQGKRIMIQQFICPYCKKSIHPEEKIKLLFLLPV